MTPGLRKKAWLKSLNESIEKQETADAQKNLNRNRKQNQDSRKKLTNYFVRF